MSPQAPWHWLIATKTHERVLSIGPHRVGEVVKYGDKFRWRHYGQDAEGYETTDMKAKLALETHMRNFIAAQASVSPTLLPRREPGQLTQDEATWFCDHQITPEGEAPAALHLAESINWGNRDRARSFLYKELPGWTAYVGWLLGNEGALSANLVFQKFCRDMREYGYVAVETATRWLEHPQVTGTIEVPINNHYGTPTVRKYKGGFILFIENHVGPSAVTISEEFYLAWAKEFGSANEDKVVFEPMLSSR